MIECIVGYEGNTGLKEFPPAKEWEATEAS
jgi:hypothetical protein